MIWSNWEINFSFNYKKPTNWISKETKKLIYFLGNAALISGYVLLLIYTPILSIIH